VRTKQIRMLRTWIIVLVTGSGPVTPVTLARAMPGGAHKTGRGTAVDESKLEDGSAGRRVVHEQGI